MLNALNVYTQLRPFFCSTDPPIHPGVKSFYLHLQVLHYCFLGNLPLFLPVLSQSTSYPEFSNSIVSIPDWTL